jgi:hypothetical protein
MGVVLQNNVLEFNDNFYLQPQGIAMGTKMAPAYANTFWAILKNTFSTEEEIKSHCGKDLLMT